MTGVPRSQGIEQVPGDLQVHRRLGAGRVAHVKNHIGQRRFLQGGTEGVHQMMGQAADQADGVNEDDRLPRPAA